jgi:nucleotide-binding universal stress UspA family protein
MTIRTLLVGASGGSASDGAIEIACRLAARFEAHLEGYHVKIDPNEVLTSAAAAGPGVILDSAWIDQLTEDADKQAAKTKAAFFDATRRHGLVPAAHLSRNGVTADWRDEVGRAATRVPRRARFFDLVILGRSDRIIDQSSSDAIEETLLASGRPVLLAPAAAPDSIGDVVAIGWDGSAQSVHAVVSALPFVQKAHRTIIMTIGEKPDADVAAAIEYLRWHGVASECQSLHAVPGVGRGEQLLAAARDVGADLLAMGAFGHKRWRETLFGGATRTIVGTSLLPVLMTH